MNYPIPVLHQHITLWFCPRWKPSTNKDFIRNISHNSCCSKLPWWAPGGFYLLHQDIDGAQGQDLHFSTCLLSSCLHEGWMCLHCCSPEQGHFHWQAGPAVSCRPFFFPWPQPPLFQAQMAWLHLLDFQPVHLYEVPLSYLFPGFAWSYYCLQFKSLFECWVLDLMRKV